MLVSSAVHAVAPINRWGVGVDAQGNYLVLDSELEGLTVNGSQIKNTLSGYSIFANYRWINFGAELGYTYLNPNNYVGLVRSYGVSYPIATLNIKNYNIYADGQYYYPLNHNFELKGLLGLGVLTTKTTGSAVVNDNGRIDIGENDSSDSSLGVRIGAGVQYNFTDDFSMAVTYKLQTGNGYFKYINIYAISATCHI